jgi:SNF2 family DNA or RNA helicase
MKTLKPFILKKKMSINCDPSFTEHSENCSCHRCHRYFNQHNICDERMETYRRWMTKVGLDEKPHQLEGIKWCLYQELCPKPQANVRGGIIADEMGLGKTILMLACIRCNFQANTLIVLPPALVDQWMNIFQRFMGHQPFLYRGQKAKKITLSELSKKPIVVTTYGMISIRYDKEQNPIVNKLHKVEWGRVIYDEAHHVRNLKTSVHKGACKIKSTITWMVTGTPINNRITDLYALCKVMGLPMTPNKEEIKKLLGMFLLRRTKKQVGLKLPPVKEHRIQVEWETPEELDLAMDIHSTMHFTSVNKENVNQLIGWLNRHPLPALIRARQMCIYPQLLHKTVDNLKKQGIVPQDMNLGKITNSSKINAVVNCLTKAKENGRRKLIFSHYRGEIDVLQKRLQDNGITCQTVDGRTNNSTRKFAIARPPTLAKFSSVCKKWSKITVNLFNEINAFLAPEVMIVQIQTACEGLNMQHFKDIYFTSPHWNPAVEDQAIARTHRIGQVDEVNVYRFVMSGFGRKTISFEQYCCMVQDKKRDVMKILD